MGLCLQPVQDVPGRLGARQTAGRTLLYKGPMAPQKVRDTDDDSVSH